MYSHILSPSFSGTLLTTLSLSPVAPHAPPHGPPLPAYRPTGTPTNSYLLHSGEQQGLHTYSYLPHSGEQ